MTADQKHKPQRGEATEKATDIPPAGPHAKPELTDEGKTPGTGILPKTDKGDKESVPGTG